MWHTLHYRTFYWKLCCGMAFLMCAVTVLVSTSLNWLAALTVKLQQHCRVKCTYLSYRKLWKFFPLDRINSPYLLKTFWLSSCSCSMDIQDISRWMVSLSSSCVSKYPYCLKIPGIEIYWITWIQKVHKYGFVRLQFQ